MNEFLICKLKQTIIIIKLTVMNCSQDRKVKLKLKLDLSNGVPIISVIKSIFFDR